MCKTYIKQFQVQREGDEPARVDFERTASGRMIITVAEIAETTPQLLTGLVGCSGCHRSWELQDGHPHAWHVFTLGKSAFCSAACRDMKPL